MDLIKKNCIIKENHRRQSPLVFNCTTMAAAMYALLVLSATLLVGASLTAPPDLQIVQAERQVKSRFDILIQFFILIFIC